MRILYFKVNGWWLFVFFCPFFLVFQKRNIRSNVRLVIFPFFLCLLLVIIQVLVNSELDKPKNKCGCTCVDTNGDGKCERVCGIEYSTLDQVVTCAIPSPPEWPPLLQVPAPEYRAVLTDFISHADLPNESCKRTGSCPVAILLTGSNRTLGQSMQLLFLVMIYFFVIDFLPCWTWDYLNWCICASSTTL